MTRRTGATSSLALNRAERQASARAVMLALEGQRPAQNVRADAGQQRSCADAGSIVASCTAAHAASLSSSRIADGSRATDEARIGCARRHRRSSDSIRRHVSSVTSVRLLKTCAQPSDNWRSSRLRDDLGRQAARPLDEAAEHSRVDQPAGTRFDQVRGALDIPGVNRVTHRLVVVTVRAEPLAGVAVDGRFAPARRDSGSARATAGEAVDGSDTSGSDRGRRSRSETGCARTASRGSRRLAATAQCLAQRSVDPSTCRGPYEQVEVLARQLRQHLGIEELVEAAQARRAQAQDLADLLAACPAPARPAAARRPSHR